MSPRRVLTPVIVTERYQSFGTGRLENWAAKSKDGLWSYHRLEMTGTPWELIHEPSGQSGGWYGSLTKARTATADGTALARVAAQQDSERAS